jgi:hypothetical protein
MKFDKIVRTILLERLYHNDTFGKSSYIKEPEQALLALDKAYDYLKKYDVARYNHSLSPSSNPENNKLGDALTTITLVIKDSNLNTYTINKKNVSKETLIKSVLKLSSQFGQTEFETEKNQHAANKKNLVDSDLYKSLQKDSQRGRGKNAISEKGPYIVSGANYPDMDGNNIPDGEQLSGSDYRLSIFVKSGVQLAKHGGIPIFNECYKTLFPMIGLRFQPYNKADAAAKNLEEFQNVEYVTLYWWGENSLPFRSLITVSDGFVRSVPTPNQEVKVGLIQFTSDQVAGHKKARPLSQIGHLTVAGAAHGDVIEGVRVGDPIGEVKDKMESEDFAPILKEKNEINELLQKGKDGDLDARKKINDAFERQKAYQQLIADGKWQEIKKIYDDRINQYWSIYNDPERFQNNARRPNLTEETSAVNGWPFFHVFKKQPNGKFKPVPASAKDKYELLYPKNIKEIEKLFYKDIVTQ